MLEIKEVTKAFGKRVIFSRFSQCFHPGKIYALIGRSGSGKTTLLNMMAKLEPYDQGEILLDGKPIHTIKDHSFFANQLGYLFQNSGLIPEESIEENLRLGLVGKKLTKAEKQKRFDDVMKTVGLEKLNPKAKVYTVSGGEAQRIALAKIFLKEPPLLLADEPTASLDPKTAEEILALLFRMRDEKRIIIIATHSPSIWERADEVVALS
ncbi:ABC transporter ATP-binding protein [Murdochiella massiliensis]|uniref:ABC transporter ATP-binding protein n=1 Tax=Murdochiella massiliensis TaxID=1673723 RepID=UPI000834C9DA|nr:ABC transporter ATP-binding protein [Murdochiella massiliensis]